MKPRNVYIDQAKALINEDRASQYGDAHENHQRIADIWSVVLGKPVSAGQVVACMIGVKLARLAHKIDNDDSWVDIIGYAALGGEITSSSEEHDHQTTKQSPFPLNTQPDEQPRWLSPGGTI